MTPRAPVAAVAGWVAQETRELPRHEAPQHFLTRMPLWATMVLWVLVGLAASLAAMPVSRWILGNDWLASKDAQFGARIDQIRPHLTAV